MYFINEFVYLSICLWYFWSEQKLIDRNEEKNKVALIAIFDTSRYIRIKVPLNKASILQRQVPENPIRSALKKCVDPP